MLPLEYIDFLESLPCNRHARRRSRPTGQWLSGWVPENKDELFKSYSSEFTSVSNRLHWGPYPVHPYEVI